MGTAISRAASGIGTVLGNTFLAPLKTILSASCEGVCSGTWDVICFIEHLCISDMLKLLMVLLIAYLTLFFIYLLFKVGIVQCIGKNLCKMSWAACETYWSALGGITCFLWHKLKDTKKVYHRRRRRRLHDVEDGYSSGEDGDMWDSKDYEREGINQGKEESPSEKEEEEEVSATQEPAVEDEEIRKEESPPQSGLEEAAPAEEQEAIQEGRIR